MEQESAGHRHVRPCWMQSKVDRLDTALKASQEQAKQADAEAQEMEKAFRVLQSEASSVSHDAAANQSSQPGALFSQLLATHRSNKHACLRASSPPDTIYKCKGSLAARRWPRWVGRLQVTSKQHTAPRCPLKLRRLRRLTGQSLSTA